MKTFKCYNCQKEFSFDEWEEFEQNHRIMSVCRKCKSILIKHSPITDLPEENLIFNPRITKRNQQQLFKKVRYEEEYGRKLKWYTFVTRKDAPPQFIEHSLTEECKRLGVPRYRAYPYAEDKYHLTYVLVGEGLESI